MEPNPRLTLLVSLSKEPSAMADSFACSGVVISGSVAISTSGSPSLSRVYVTTSPYGVDLVSRFLAEYSSKHITETPTSPVSVSN